jgi:hypothetical protein
VLVVFSFTALELDSGYKGFGCCSQRLQLGQLRVLRMVNTILLADKTRLLSRELGERLMTLI